MRASVVICLALTCLSGFGEGREGDEWSLESDASFRLLTVRRAQVEDVDCRWSVLRDGLPFAAGSLSFGKNAGEAVATCAAPPALQAARDLGGSVSLRVRFLRDEIELALRQIDLPEPSPRAYVPLQGEKVETLENTASRLVFRAGGKEISFSKRTGLLERYVAKGVFSDDRVLDVPMVLVAEGEGATCEAFAHTVESFSDVSERPDGVAFSALVRAVRPRGAENAILVLKWRVFRDGAVACLAQLRPEPGRTLPARVGFAFVCDDDADEVAYFAPHPLLGRTSCDAAAFLAQGGALGGVRSFEVGGGSDIIGFGAVDRPFALKATASRNGLRACLFPNAVDDVRRPRRLDFIIGQRRFANVVRIN